MERKFDDSKGIGVMVNNTNEVIKMNNDIDKINALTEEPEINKIYTGKVANIVDFGAFVTIMPGRDGLVHVSEISEERVENVSDYFVEGEEVKVKVLEVDRQGKIRLTMKGLED